MPRSPPAGRVPSADLDAASGGSQPESATAQPDKTTAPAGPTAEDDVESGAHSANSLRPWTCICIRGALVLIQFLGNSDVLIGLLASNLPIFLAQTGRA